MKVFLLGARPSFPQSPGQTAEEKLVKTGGNIGNQIIARGLLKSLRYDQVSWDYSLGPERINEEFDLMVIAAANFLCESFDFAYMANFIEATNLPCAMVGLGAQASSFSTDIPLKDGTKRLVQVVADRSTSIGVRGPFTADVVAGLGVKNVQVVGCPSYYQTCKPELQFRERPGRLERVAINGSRDVARHAFDRDLMISVLRGLVGAAVKDGYDFIAQTEINEIRFAETTDPASEEHSFRNFAYLFKGVAADADLRTWLRSKTRVFWDVEAWFEAMIDYDFVIGTRFHGAIAAITSEIPACVICHDTRTTELCAFLEIPNLSLLEAQDLDIRAVYERTDMQGTADRYRQLYPLYKEFLEANNLPHRLL